MTVRVLGKKATILIALFGLLLLSCRQQPPAAGMAGGTPVLPTAATAAAAPVPSATTATSAPRELALDAVGDIMLDRKVGERIKAVGCAAIIQELAPALGRADLVFGNLESPLSTVGAHDPKNNCFRADPAAIKVLTLGHFGMVSYANNHCLDPGRAGYLQTLKHLDDAGIRYTGAAADPSQAYSLRIMEVNGLKVGFMGFTDLDFNTPCYSKVPHDLAAHQRRIAQAKNKCDLLVVSYHWGTEYSEKPTDRQRTLAHATIDAGADLVLGHHPHVLEGVEFYKGHPITYCMGNFIFDQRPGIKMDSALFKLFYKEGVGWSLKIVPLWLPPGRYGPVYPGPEKRDAILQRMAGYCQALGTATHVENGVLVVAGR
jgi:poly-gamma-glutamate synthesis protein (capsule biosynthesis protein)